MGFDINNQSMKPKETFIDKELDRFLEECKNFNGPSIKLIEQVIIICYLQGAQGQYISRSDLAKILPKILETAELSAATYNGRKFLAISALAGIGALANIAGGAYGSVNIPAAAKIANEATSKALIAEIEKKCSLASGIGQFFSQSSSLWGESEKGPRELLNHKMQDLNFLKEKTHQLTQTTNQKVEGHLKALQQLHYLIHQIFSQVTSNQN